MLWYFHAGCEKGTGLKMSSTVRAGNRSTHHTALLNLCPPLLLTMHSNSRNSRHMNLWHCVSAKREGGKEHVHQHREVIQRFPCCKFYSLDHFRSNFYSLLYEWSCLLHVLEIDKNCRIIAANWTNGSSSVSLFTSANMNCQVPLKERDTESNITNEPKRLLNVWKHLVHDATLSNLLNRSSGNIIWFVRYHLKNGIAVTAEGHEESLRVLAHHILSGSMGSIQEEEKFFLFCCSVFCQNAPWPTSS